MVTVNKSNYLIRIEQIFSNDIFIPRYLDFRYPFLRIIISLFPPKKYIFLLLVHTLMIYDNKIKHPLY